MHFEDQCCLDRKKEEFVSDMLCPFYPSICNSSSVQATLCLSRSPLQRWGATTMQGFLSPAVGRRRHEKKAVIPCILLCPAGYQSRAAAWGRGGVCLLDSGRQLCWSSLVHRRGDSSIGHVSAILHCNFYCQSPSSMGSNHFMFLSQIS